MRKTLDFNSIEKPTLELKMKDDAQTKITVCTPTQALIEELEANYSSIKEAAQGTAESINTMYTLAAKLINVNQEGIVVTAEELRTKYKMEFLETVVFFSVYMDFIDEIKAAKN